MSKVNIGIKTTQDLYTNIHSLLDSAKELGAVKEKNDYFEITYPYFEEYLRRKELTKSEIGSTLTEIERSTAIIIKQFMNMIDSHENIVTLSEMKYKEIIAEKDRKLIALTSLLEKIEIENMQLKNSLQENEALKEKVIQLEGMITKQEIKYERQINKLDKEYVKKLSNFQSFFNDKLNEVN